MFDADDQKTPNLNEDGREHEEEVTAPSLQSPSHEPHHKRRRVGAAAEQWHQLVADVPDPTNGRPHGSVSWSVTPPSIKATTTTIASDACDSPRKETVPDLQGAQAQDENTPVHVIIDPVQHDNEHALQDDVAGEVTTSSLRDREHERRWSTRAADAKADALRGFRPAPGPGTGRHESLGPGSDGVEGGAGTGDGGLGSKIFFIYVIGATESPTRDCHGSARLVRRARGATGSGQTAQRDEGRY
ncbi:hypothetical protein EI94DRAFT_1790723 [Lactarius quietus]|nr:hypothetical protein EI94DRAFT_1790723 [Lactarius quietus]